MYEYEDPYEFADDWAEEFMYDEGFYDDIDKSYQYGDAYDDAWDFAYDYWWQKVKGRGPACESWHSNRRAIEIYWGKISLA